MDAIIAGKYLYNEFPVNKTVAGRRKGKKTKMRLKQKTKMRLRIAARDMGLPSWGFDHPTTNVLSIFKPP
jgi:hypothetical protein